MKARIAAVAVALSLPTLAVADPAAARQEARAESASSTTPKKTKPPCRVAKKAPKPKAAPAAG